MAHDHTNLNEMDGVVAFVTALQEKGGWWLFVIAQISRAGPQASETGKCTPAALQQYKCCRDIAIEQSRKLLAAGASHEILELLPLEILISMHSSA